MIKKLNTQSTYIYTTDLNSTSSLYINLINAYLLYLASAMHSLGFVCYNSPMPYHRIADERIVLSTNLLCTNAYPLSTHGSVHRIATFGAEWLSTPHGLQLSTPCGLQCIHRIVTFDAEWLSTPRGLQRLIAFLHLCVHAKTTSINA